jgi:hypothetical protein
LKTPSLRAKSFGWDEDVQLAPRPKAGIGQIDIDPDIDLSLVNQSGEGNEERRKDGRHVDKWQEKLKNATSHGKTVREKREDWWKSYRQNQGGFKKKEGISDYKKKVILMKYERIKKKNKRERAPIQWEGAADSASEPDDEPVRERPKQRKKEKKVTLEGEAKTGGSKFEQAKRRYEEIQQERKKHREEVAAARQKHQEAVKEYLDKRKERFRNFSRKTKKGQPLMKYRIEYLLGRVQDMIQKEKGE